MAIFIIGGDAVTEEQFLKSVEVIKFPKLSDHAEAILNVVDEHQKEFGRKDEEFPDSQKEWIQTEARSNFPNTVFYIEKSKRLELLRDALLASDEINTPWDILSVLSCDDENELRRMLRQERPKSFSYKPGKKHNQNKPQMSRLFEQFPNALQIIVLASTYGANKYSEGSQWDNFLSVPGGSKSYLDATLRHFIDPDNQDESGLPHIGHFAWNALAALELFCREKEINMKEFSENYLKNL